MQEGANHLYVWNINSFTNLTQLPMLKNIEPYYDYSFLNNLAHHA